MGKRPGKKEKEYRHLFSRAFTYEEGLCVQMMHIGSFDSETESVKMMDEMIDKEGYVNDFSSHSPP